jgi:hypothetical protein
MSSEVVENGLSDGSEQRSGGEKENRRRIESPDTDVASTCFDPVTELSVVVYQPYAVPDKFGLLHRTDLKIAGKRSIKQFSGFKRPYLWTQQHENPVEKRRRNRSKDLQVSNRSRLFVRTQLVTKRDTPSNTEYANVQQLWGVCYPRLHSSIRRQSRERQRLCRVYDWQRSEVRWCDGVSNPVIS